MRTVNYKGKVVRVPSEASELSPAQYMRCLEISTMALQGMLSEGQARLKLLTLFLELPVDASLLPRSYIPEALSLLELTDPFIGKTANGFRLKLECGVNLLPSWEGWKGPQDMLNDVSFGTYCRCLTLMNDIGTGADTANAALHELGSLLYRDGKGTQPPPMVCLHAFVYAQHVFHLLRQGTVNVDGEDIDLRILFQRTGKHRAHFDDRTGWTGIGMDVAETGVFGTYAQVQQTPFWDVLLFLYKKKFENLHKKR